MWVWHGLGAVDPDAGPCVVTIGNFDGVHRGHCEVLAAARALADRLGGLPVVVVTFDPHPMRVIRPDKAPQPLTTIEEREALLAASGADAVLVLEFTSELADMEAADFAESVVFGALHANAVVVGENFRFGHRALGDVALLTELGARHGAEVIGLPLSGQDGAEWSSTSARGALVVGDVRAVEDILGRPCTVTGRVVRGDRRGRQLGYPTANIPVDASRTAVPSDGVYAGWLRRLDEDGAPDWPAAISVGTNPTFNGTERRVEAYVLDRDDLELYDAMVEVRFIDRLRGMERFDTVDDLLAQMRRDVDESRRLLTSQGDSGHR